MRCGCRHDPGAVAACAVTGACRCSQALGRDAREHTGPHCCIQLHNKACTLAYVRAHGLSEMCCRFGRLKNVKLYIAGRNVFVRFSCFTGDAMGMNMVTKGASAALEVIAP